MANPFRNLLTIFLIVTAGLYLFTPSIDETPEEISKARFDQLIENDAMVNMSITPLGYDQVFKIEGVFRRSSTGKKSQFTLTTHLSEAKLEQALASSKASLTLPKFSTRSKLLDIVPALLVIALVIGLVAYQVNIGRSKTGSRIKERPTVRFDEVAGIEEAKGEVHEVIDFLRSPAKYRRLGGRLPKGLLLIGPPGTGKTMLARAIACEAQANFFSASGSDFNEVFVGVGAKRIRQLFKQARKHSPAIIFIDEIDCLGKNRASDQHGELQQTNNALLTAMDGFEAAEGVIVIAATNRPQDLDEALMRPGRFDRKIYVPLPDAKGRRSILVSHSQRTRMNADDAALDLVAQTTVGMAGADLANLINEAAILAAVRNKQDISLIELEEARDKVRWGKERKSMVLKDAERRIVAFHEAGHALIHLHMPLLPPLHKVTIIPRGQSLGSTTALPREDQNIHSKKFLLQQLAVLMGGRAAEQIFFGDITNGANGDLDAAKDIARRMIHDWGMGERLFYELQKDDAEKEINQILAKACEDAHRIITDHRAQTETLAEALLQRETISREEATALIAPTHSHPTFP